MRHHPAHERRRLKWFMNPPYPPARQGWRKHRGHAPTVMSRAPVTPKRGDTRPVGNPDVGRGAGRDRGRNASQNCSPWGRLAIAADLAAVAETTNLGQQRGGGGVALVRSLVQVLDVRIQNRRASRTRFGEEVIDAGGMHKPAYGAARQPEFPGDGSDALALGVQRVRLRSVGGSAAPERPRGWRRTRCV